MQKGGRGKEGEGGKDGEGEEKRVVSRGERERERERGWGGEGGKGNKNILVFTLKKTTQTIRNTCCSVGDIEVG